MSDEHSVALSIIQRDWNIWFWTKFPVSGFGGAISYSDYHDFFEIKSCLCIRKYLPIFECRRRYAAAIFWWYYVWDSERSGSTDWVVSKLLFDQPVRIFADSTSITIPIYWCKVITAVQIEKVELKFCERIRNRRMRKEDAYMASMQSFAMGTSFQLPVEIVLEGDRPVKSETFMIWMRALIDNALCRRRQKTN